MSKHFELTSESKINFLGVKLFRLKLTVDCKWGKAGELGGWAQKEANLSGDAWVSGNAQVYGNARVYGNAWVYGNAMVSGNAMVYGDAMVSDDARVYGDAWVSGNAQVYGNARVYGNAWVYGNAMVSGNAMVYGDAMVSDDARVSDDATICWFSKVGSTLGTLTVFLNAKKEICVTRGCFYGTLKEFEEAVIKTHADNQTGKEYYALIAFIKIKFGIKQ